MKIKISMRIDEKLLEKIDDQAKKEDRTRSNVIESQLKKTYRIKVK